MLSDPQTAGSIPNKDSDSFPDVCVCVGGVGPHSNVGWGGWEGGTTRTVRRQTDSSTLYNFRLRTSSATETLNNDQCGGVALWLYLELKTIPK